MMNPLEALFMNQQMVLPITDSVAAAKSEPVPPPPPPSPDGQPTENTTNQNPQDTMADHWLRIIEESKTASENKRKPHKGRWDVCWDLFNNRYDFSKKAEWQSKNWIPKIPTLVRSMSNLIKSYLKQSKDVGQVTGYGELSKSKAPMMNKLVGYAMHKGNFVGKLVEALMSGMLSSGVNLKVYPMAMQVDTTGSTTGGPANFSMGGFKTMVAYEAVSEYSLHRDPTGRDKYKIHTFEMDLADLKELAKDPSNGYDAKAVEEITGSFVIEEENYERAKREGTYANSTTPTFRKTVTVEEFWGDIYDREGNLVHRKGTMSRANKKYMVRPPMANPYHHGKDPFICCFPTKVPFSTWHESYVYAVCGLATMITEIMNLTLDANLFDSLRVFQVDTDKITDPTDLMGGLWPGKVVKAENTDGKPIMQAMPMGQVSRQQGAVYNLLSSELNNGSGASEFSIPQLAVGDSGIKTATEVTETKQQSEIFTNSLAQVLEEEVIEPSMDMTRDLIVQYFNDFQNPEVVDLLGMDALVLQQARNDEERIHLLGGNYASQTNAISGILKRYDTLKQMQVIEDSVAKFPLLANMINIPEFLKEKMSVVGLDPKRFLLLPDDPNLKALEARLQQQPSPLASQLMQHRQERGIPTPFDSPPPEQLSGSGLEALAA